MDWPTTHQNKENASFYFDLEGSAQLQLDPERTRTYKPTMALPKKKKVKAFNRGKYETQARDIGKQLKKAGRNPSGYLTPAASELSAGKGLLSYTPPESEPKEDKSASPSASPSPSPAPEDGFMAFDDVDESHPLAEQFKTFEKDLNKIPLPQYPAPWMQEAAAKGTVLEKFTHEIKSWLVYVSPQSKEISDRQDLVTRIQNTIKRLLPGVQCHLFGSSATDMYLPMADVDMVMIPNHTRRNEKSMLYLLREHVRRNQWSDNILVIGRARVPIVKFKDNQTRLQVDISVGQAGGVAAIKTVKAWSEATPALKPLVLIVKQFLKCRRMAEVFHGGLGGYATICLVKSFLENHPKLQSGEISAMDNLGQLLFEFFEFYGDEFDCRTYALRMTGKMPRVLKRTSGALQTQRPELLSIEDPNDHTNNVTKSSYNWPSIRKEFGHAADLLKRMMHDSDNGDKGQGSFLSVLLKNEKKVPRHAAEDLEAKLKKLQESVKSDTKRAKKRASLPVGLPAKPDVTAGPSLPAKPSAKLAKSSKPERASERPSSSERLSSSEKKKKKKEKRKSQSPAPTPTKSAKAPRVLEELFEPAETSQSDSDAQVTGIAHVNNTKQNPIVLSSDEEESRTKTAAKTKQNIQKRRQFWAQKNGI